MRQKSKNMTIQRLVGVSAGYLILMAGVGSVQAGVADYAQVGVSTSVEAPEKKAAPKAAPKSKPKAQPARKVTPTKKSAPVRAKPAPRPSPKPVAKPAPRRTSKPKARPAAQPKARPTKRPVSQPSRPVMKKPVARPSTKPTISRPSVRTRTEPISRPTTKYVPKRTPTVAPKSTTRSIVESTPVSTRTNLGSRDELMRTKIGRRVGVTRDLVTAVDSAGKVKRGEKRKFLPMEGREGRVKEQPAFVEHAPLGFDVSQAKADYINQMQNDPAGLVDLDLDLDIDIDVDVYQEDHHNDYDEHGDHDVNIDVHIDVDIYTNSSCPSGWWYVYGDYDGDGYTDYVCTNGSYSVYWFGWTGSYWGGSPWYGWYGSRYSSSRAWWWHSVSDRYRGPVYGVSGDLGSDSSYSSEPVYQEEMPEAMPLSAIEVARLEMSFGEPAIAIDAYRAHLREYPNDWSAVREFGLAKILAGDRGDGIALVSYAYSMAPDLAFESVPMSLFQDSSRELRDAVIDVVGWGHRNPSASVWLTAAVLMQAQDREGPALRMIERAEDYGLDGEVESSMYSALANR